MGTNTKVLVIPHGVQEALILNNYIKDMRHHDISITPIFPPTVSVKENMYLYGYSDLVHNYIMNYQNVVDEIEVISFPLLPKSFDKNVVFDCILDYISVESERKLKSKTLSMIQYVNVTTLEQVCELISYFMKPGPPTNPNLVKAWEKYKMTAESDVLSKHVACSALFSEFLKVTFANDEDVTKLMKETGLSKASIRNYVHNKHITDTTACTVFNAVRNLITFTKTEEWFINASKLWLY